MSLTLALILAGFATLVGGIVGYFLRWLVSLGSKGSVELKIKQMMLEAKDEASRIIGDAEEKAKKSLAESRNEIKEKETAIKKTEDRLIKKEELLDRRQLDIDSEAEAIKEKIVEIKTLKEKADALLKDREAALIRVSALSEEEARAELLNIVEKQAEEDIQVRMQKLEALGKEKLDRRAQEIITTAIQRYGNSVAQDIMSTSVTIPNDEIKGKIIGKEGRNIKAFERATGVEVIVDDTPGTITISSFDPVRRQIARLALENLVLDGRIQPARIEEVVEKAKLEVNTIIKEKGEQAAYECGIYNFDPRLIAILGRLYFRTSYGQNVLQHSVEMAHIAGLIAEELKVNVAVAKAGALVHDIGKALDHEVAGTHVEIGRRILQKFGVDEAIIKAMQAHHEEYPYETPESVIVQVADAISGGRPGARRDTVENYLKRLAELEAIANNFSGVEKSFAIQAGREIRVFVNPHEISDTDTKKLARDIALKIESDLKYPGEIKVVMIRENRIIEFAR